MQLPNIKPTIRKPCGTCGGGKNKLPIAMTITKPGEKPVTVTPPVPEAELKAINKLAVACCYFNPQHYKKPYDNFLKFKNQEAMTGCPLYVVELAFDDDDFELPFSHLQIRGRREDQLMFQKERLLNLLIKTLPSDVDAIAWIDADILFLNANWVEETKEKLRTRQVVQLFADGYNLFPSGRLESVGKGSGFNYVKNRRLYLNSFQSHPGFAWAGRAEWLKQYGLYDKAVCLSGDTVIVKGVSGHVIDIEQLMSPGWQADVKTWSDNVSGIIKGSLDYVQGSVLHLMHGTWNNRKYGDRWAYLLDYGFNPATDICDDPENGLLTWSSFALQEKSGMVEAIANNFAERREDESGN